MQIRSNLWKELAASGNVKMETVVVMDGHEYTPKGDVAISRTSGQGALSIGNTITATVQFSVERAEGVAIPNTPAAVVKIRYIDGERATEWMERGTFYVSRRQKDVVSEILDFQGYDAMIRADAPFPRLSGFPKAMNSVVMEIARNMGLEVDSRTWTGLPAGADYYVPLPANGEKMIKVLGYIGGVCGGNWIITPGGKLRLVPLVSASGAASASDRAEIAAIMSGITTGEPMTVTGVAVTGQNSMLAGTETGAVVTLAANPYITQATLNALLTRYNGLVYVPYEIKSGIYDPAAEIGDYLISREDIASVIWAENAKYAPMFRGDLSAPFTPETSGSEQSISDAIGDTGGGYEDLSVRFYKFVNQSAVTVADGQSAEIINFDFAAGSEQDVIFHAEVKHTVTTTETGNAGTGWIENDAVLTVTYYINGAEVTEYHPVRTETDGVNLLHLNYQWGNGKYNAGNFRAVLAVSGGGVSIAAGDIHAYIIGQGAVGGGTDGGWIAEDGLVFVCVETYPKLDYEYDETLDLSGMVVKAYYADGREADVTAQCTVSPAHGAELEEGENVVDVSYTEDGKTFSDSFSVYRYGDGYRVLYIEVEEPPTRTEYFPGEALDLSGLVVAATQENGWVIRNIKPDCTFSPAEGDALPEPGTVTVTVTRTYSEALGYGTFTAYFDVGVKTVRITAYPVKSDYKTGETLDYTGLEVREMLSDGTTRDVTADCVILPAEGTLITEPGDIMIDVRYDDKSLGTFWVAAERGVIVGGDWWTLCEDGTLDIYCDGGIPNYHYAQGSYPPWYRVFENGQYRYYSDFVVHAHIADSVTYIGDEAFYSCDELESITIGSGVTSMYIYGGLYKYTLDDYSPKLSAIFVSPDNQNYSASDGVLFNKNQTALLLFPKGKTGAYKIPDSVTYIQNCAFENSHHLTSVTIPDSVTSISVGMFRGCDHLASVTIPDSVTSIKSHAFQYSGLTSVTIPDSVTSIEYGAFAGCDKLRNVYYSGAETQWNAITISSDNGYLTRATIHYNSTGPT